MVSRSRIINMPLPCTPQLPMRNYMRKIGHNISRTQSSLMQLFSEFISVLKTFRYRRNYLYLMALNREPTTLANMDLSLQQYLSYVTPYVFSHIKHQWEASKSLLNNLTCYSTTINHCDCNLMKSMGLPYKHLFHRRLEMGLMLFDASLIKDR